MLRDGLMTCPRQATRAVHILMLAMVFEHRLDHAGGRPFGRQLRVRLWEGHATQPGRQIARPQAVSGKVVITKDPKASVLCKPLPTTSCSAGVEATAHATIVSPALATERLPTLRRRRRGLQTDAFSKKRSWRDCGCSCPPIG